MLYIDLHLVHEVTSPQAFSGLRERGLKVRRPDLTMATVDHSIPTTPRSLPIVDKIAATQVAQLETNCKEFGIPCYGFHSDKQGIVHVIGPERGVTQPGMTVVCGDSHTATHGAFGALAFGIGTSEVEHVLATQCLLQRKSKTYQVLVEGSFETGVSAKDIILNLISRIGIGGGTGCVFEYCGSRHPLAVDGRAHDGLQHVDRSRRARRPGRARRHDVSTILNGRPLAPKGADWDAAVARWKQLPTDEGAGYDQQHHHQRDRTGADDHLRHQSRHGHLDHRADSRSGEHRRSDRARFAGQGAALHGSQAGEPLLGHPVNVVFIGSCTNSRMSDLARRGFGAEGPQGEPECSRDGGARLAWRSSGRRKPRGSTEIFREAGADWREAGCSMCIAMNGDQLQPGEYSVSTSNRNFEGRQGKGGRTFLASPLTAAATAITGKVTDVRSLAE